MAAHNTLGNEGEELAAHWLVSKGYKVIHRNWRHLHYEIDIVATRGDTLHIIEVKCRNDSPFGYPEDSVSRKKFRALKKAAHEFLFRHHGHRWLQYDILAITLFKYREPEFLLLEDVFL